jgi:hypothetical protein
MNIYHLSRDAKARVQCCDTPQVLEQATALRRERQHVSDVGSTLAPGHQTAVLRPCHSRRLSRLSSLPPVSGLVDVHGPRVRRSQRASALRAPPAALILPRVSLETVLVVRRRQDGPIFLDTIPAGHGSGCFERPLETSIDCISPYEINW